jgi:hypothetical protein
LAFVSAEQFAGGESALPSYMCPRVVTYVNESTYCSRNYKEKVKPKVEDGDANYFEY